MKFNPSDIRALRKRLIVPILLVSLTIGCSIQFPWSKSGDDSKESKKPPEVIIPVEAALPERGNISAYFETNTRVEAEIQSDIAAEGAGRCEGVFVEEGDLVTAGQILAELDKDEAEVALSQAEVEVRQRKIELDRAANSSKAGLISQSEYDSAVFAHDQSVERVKTQRVQLENLTVRAPFDGVITARSVQQGTLVSSGFACFHIVDPSSFMLTIAPPEKELSRLKIGQAAEVTIDALPGEVFFAKVRRISPSVDPATGTVKVILDFEFEDQVKLRSSAFARVKLVMETHENALLVPKDAIIEENARTFVYVVRERETEPESENAEQEDEGVSTPEAVEEKSDKKVLAVARDEGGQPGTEAGAGAHSTYEAVQIEIETGLENSNFVEITSSLTDRDLIVINGQHTLKPGSRLKITNLTEELRQRAQLSAEEALVAAESKRLGEQQDSKGRSRHRRR